MDNQVLNQKFHDQCMSIARRDAYDTLMAKLPREGSIACCYT